MAQRRWSLSLEAFRVALNQPIVESPDDLQVGSIVDSGPQSAMGHPMFIRYLPAGAIPTISALDIDRQRELLRGKIVFLGVTALSAANDRQMIPDGYEMCGGRSSRAGI